MTPFGFLYPLCGRADEKNCFFLRCLLAAMTLSLTIELLQPLINDARSADITDVITNTVGGMYLREVKDVGNRRYESCKCTCGKRERWEIAGTNRTGVRAGSEGSWKPQVGIKQMYVRKVRKAGNRRYRLDKCTCGEMLCPCFNYAVGAS